MSAVQHLARAMTAIPRIRAADLVSAVFVASEHREHDRCGNGQRPAVGVRDRLAKDCHSCRVNAGLPQEICTWHLAQLRRDNALIPPRGEQQQPQRLCTRCPAGWLNLFVCCRVRTRRGCHARCRGWQHSSAWSPWRRHSISVQLSPSIGVWRDTGPVSVATAVRCPPSLDA